MLSLRLSSEDVTSGDGPKSCLEFVLERVERVPSYIDRHTLTTEQQLLRPRFQDFAV